MTIWEFPLKMIDQQRISMPIRSRILSCQVQGETVCLWALVYPDLRSEVRSVFVLATGHPIPQIVTPQWFVGTIQFHGGALVFHVFVEPV